MTTRYKTRAFVFKKSDRNESDRTFSVFTDDFGRLDIFAKAIRKITSKLRSGMDVFFMSEIEFIQGKNRKTLTDATTIERFDNIPQDLEKFKIASKIGEFLNDFIKGEEKDERLFNLVNETFTKLNNCKLPIANYQLLYFYFLWNALSLLGYHSEVKECASCHGKLNPYSIYFSSKEGGIICGGCANFKKTEGPEPCRRINSDIAKILRIILSKDLQTLFKLKVEPSSQKLFKEISDDYYLYILSSHSFK